MNRKILYAVGDRLLRYVYKNPRRNLVKLVKVGKLVAGKMFPPSTFTKPIEIIEDEDNVWHQFLFRGLDEVDPALGLPASEVPGPALVVDPGAELGRGAAQSGDHRAPGLEILRQARA